MMGKRDVITQGELQRALDAQTAVNRTLWQIRKRLDSGASVQSGSLDIDVDPSKPLQPFYSCETLSSRVYGISIDAAEWVAVQGVCREMRITVGQLRSPVAIPLYSRFDESTEGDVSAGLKGQRFRRF
jgi:hypothetical protein